MKRFITVILTVAMTVGLLAGCGTKADTGKDTGPTGLAGTCEEILTQVYADADLDADLREAMKNYEMSPIDETREEYILGTTGVDYTDSVYSAPMMSSIAYQCVVLRVSEGEDVEGAKQQLLDNADPIKWVCVEAESVVVENVGDVILYIMADQATADAVKTAFLSAGEL